MKEGVCVCVCVCVCILYIHHNYTTLPPSLPSPLPPPPCVVYPSVVLEETVNKYKDVFINATQQVYIYVCYVIHVYSFYDTGAAM